MNFEFQNPTRLIFGTGTLVQLGEVVSKHGKEALIVTGGCAGVNAAPVKSWDLGILASTDILAVEQVSIDIMYRLPEAEIHDGTN